MNFFESIHSGFSNYMNFKGRAIRSEYNYWILFAFLVGAITGILDFSIGYNDFDDPSPINSIASIILFFPGISVMVRRFHDINKSGWNYYWCLTIIGVIPVIYWLFFKEGNNGNNFYGTNPLAGNLEDEKNNIDFDNISKLERLAKLKEQNHITEEEYNQKKKELL
mgnify:CR=1 FL=1